MQQLFSSVLLDQDGLSWVLLIPCIPQGGEDHCQGLKQRRQGQVTYEEGTFNPFHHSDASQTGLKSLWSIVPFYDSKKQKKNEHSNGFESVLHIIFVLVPYVLCKISTYACIWKIART